MTSSNSKLYRNIPSPNESKGSVYARFIPREELSSFSAWSPGSLSGEEEKSAAAAKAQAQAEAPAPPPPEDPAVVLRAARQSGYQDGYRDGLAALEQFKQSFAAQMSSRVGALLLSHGEQLDALQHEMAFTLAGCAISLARQLVRSELATQPECVASVAQEAVEALLQHARHVSLRVHPDDQPLVAEGAAEVLKARGVRLISDATVSRGGCLVESDMGAVDASIESRWQRAVALLGSEAAWDVPAASVDGMLLDESDDVTASGTTTVATAADGLAEGAA